MIIDVKAIFLVDQLVSVYPGSMAAIIACILIV